MVGVTGFEPAASTSQTSRATNCATPRYAIKLWSCKWSNLWSNTFLTAFFHFPNRPKYARLKGFRRFSLSCGANTVYAPKPRVLSAELHPDIQFLPLYHGERENQRFFCLWSFMWSKPLLRRFLQSGKIQQTPVSQGFAAFHLALSRIAPRHTQTTRATNCATPGYIYILVCFLLISFPLSVRGASLRNIVA